MPRTSLPRMQTLFGQSVLRRLSLGKLSYTHPHRTSNGDGFIGIRLTFPNMLAKFPNLNCGQILLSAAEFTYPRLLPTLTPLSVACLSLFHLILPQEEPTSSSVSRFACGQASCTTLTEPILPAIFQESSSTHFQIVAA